MQLGASLPGGNSWHAAGRFRHGSGAAGGCGLPLSEDRAAPLSGKNVAGSRHRDFSEKGFLSLQPDFCGDHPTETDCES